MFRYATVYDDKVKSLADALPYAVMYEPGIVMTKGGGFIASWAFAGPDTGAASASDLNALAARVNDVLNRRDDGWHQFTNAYRTESREYPATSHFPDRTTKMIDIERGELYKLEGRHFETHHVVSLMYTHPQPTKSKVENFFIDAPGTNADSSFTKAIALFKAGIDDFERTIGRLLSMRRLMTRDVMGADDKQYVVCDQLSYFHYCVTGEDVQIRVPPVGMYLDAILGGEDMILGPRPMIGSKHVRVVGILGFPDNTIPGMLDQLNALPFAYRFSTRATFLGKERALLKINTFEKNWGQKTTSLLSTMMGTANKSSTKVNSYAAELQASANDALHLAQSDRVKFLHYTAAVIVMDEDRAVADEAALEIAKVINNCGFVARVETKNAARAFNGSWPGEIVANKRRPILHTLNLAHLLPLTGIWAGPIYTPSPMYPQKSPPLFYGATTGATPFRFSPFSSAARDIGHTLIIGPSGSGKSTLLGLMVAQHMRYPDAMAFVFDRGSSMMPLIRAMRADGSAQHHHIDEKSKLGLCPLSNIHESNAERSWAASWIESMAALQAVPITPDDRYEIANGIQLLAGERSRSLTNLKPKIASSKLKMVLETIIMGPLGGLLNAERDGVDMSPVHCFELEDLMKLEKRYAVPVLQYLIHVIDRRIGRRPAMLVMDEAWTMLEDEFMAPIIRAWLKTLRKKNCFVVFGTQGLDDLKNAPALASVILQECVTKIWLPNFQANKGEAKKLYLAVGLSEHETDILTRLTMQLDYFYTSPSGRRVFRLELGPVTLSIIGASGGEDLARIFDLSNRDPRGWVTSWLNERAQNSNQPDLSEWGHAWREFITPDAPVTLTRRTAA